MDTTSSPKPPSGWNADRYVSMSVSARPLHELYGIEEALEDFLEAATDPEYAAFSDLLANAAPNTDGWYSVRGADMFKSGREAMDEYQAAYEVVVEVVIPTVFTLGDEEYELHHRFLITGDQEALLKLAWSMLERVQKRIKMLEASPDTSRAPSVPAAQ